MVSRGSERYDYIEYHDSILIVAQSFRIYRDKLHCISRVPQEIVHRIYFIAFILLPPSVTRF